MLQRDTNKLPFHCLQALTGFGLPPVSCVSAGELQKMSCPVEAACGEDVRAGPGEGRDPHESALVSGLAEPSRAQPASCRSAED